MTNNSLKFSIVDEFVSREIDTMEWTPYSIRRSWPRAATIRPPHENKIKTVEHRPGEVMITTHKNKSYTLTVRDENEIRYIKFRNNITCRVEYWSSYECFKCQTYLKPDEHEFVKDGICFKCLRELIKITKQKVLLHVTTKRKPRQILL